MIRLASCLLAFALCVPAMAQPVAQQTPARGLYVITYRPGPTLVSGQSTSLTNRENYIRNVFETNRLFSNDFNPDRGGTTIVRAADMAEAEAILAADPVILNGSFVGAIEAWTPRFRSRPPLIRTREDNPNLPPNLPFARWNAETAEERELDRLISEVVTMMEAERFDLYLDPWRARDIHAEYGTLRLSVPNTHVGGFTGHNFMFYSPRLGTYFHANFNLADIRFFVPSACRRRVLKGRTSDEVAITREQPYEFQSAHAPPVEQNVGLLIYIMDCGPNIRLRLYESYPGSPFGSMNTEAAGSTRREDLWRSIAIVRAGPDPRRIEDRY